MSANITKVMFAIIRYAGYITVTTEKELNAKNATINFSDAIPYANKVSS